MANSDLLYELADGNPGAFSVVSQLESKELRALKRTSLRGSDIWIGYRDICGEDMVKFTEMIKDETLFDAVAATPDWKFMHENEK